MKMRNLFFTMLAFSVFTSYGQGKSKSTAAAKGGPVNMITNGDFEESTVRSLKTYGQLEELAPGWFGANATIPDLYADVSKSTKVHIPDNDYGVQDTYSGGAYAGFCAYTKDVKKSRSYLENQLNAPLIKDKVYCVKFNVSLADLSKSAVNGIGLFISDRKVEQPNAGNMTLEPQIKVKNNAVIKTMEGWETICGTFIATGKEKYIIIGCFGNDDAVKIEKVKRPSGMTSTQIAHAYYYVDAVEMTEVATESQCNCGSAEEREPELIYSRATGITPEMKPIELIPRVAVYYSFLSSEITSLFDADLDQVLAGMRSNPQLKITITGHAETEEMNEAKVNVRFANLAQRRADGVKQYFIDKGISEGRLITVSKDNTEPATTTLTPMGRAQNRRVTLALQ